MEQDFLEKETDSHLAKSYRPCMKPERFAAVLHRETVGSVSR